MGKRERRYGQGHTASRIEFGGRRGAWAGQISASVTNGKGQGRALPRTMTCKTQWWSGRRRGESEDSLLEEKP